MYKKIISAVLAVSVLLLSGCSGKSDSTQSASKTPEELTAIHRPHTAQQADEGAALARKAGLDNLSLDLIYGLPGQTMTDWEDTLAAWRENGMPAVHHSEAYRKAEKPAYRIVGRVLLAEAGIDG